MFGPLGHSYYMGWARREAQPPLIPDGPRRAGRLLDGTFRWRRV